MRTSVLLMAFASLGVLGSVAAQTTPQESSNPPARQKSPPKAKVWTNDDLGSLRSPADIYAEKQKGKAEQEAKAKTAAPEQPAIKPDPADHPPRLSNPKTVEAADGMIAWEQRDIDAQTEYVERLRKQLEEAPQEEKAHLQELIEERTRIIAETKAEQLGLMQQRTQLLGKRGPAESPSQ